MTNVAFAGLAWMMLGAYMCIRYYSDDPRAILSVSIAASQAVMAVADCIDAFGLTPPELITLAAIAIFVYDIRATIRAHLADWHKIKMK